jgi:hypothetical protein
MNVVGFLGGRNLLPEKLRGRFRVPGLLLANTSLSASFSSLPFSWLPWFYSPFHFSWTAMQRCSVATY